MLLNPQPQLTVRTETVDVDYLYQLQRTTPKAK